jgi:ketosteroid isomerase-like protein
LTESGGKAHAADVAERFNDCINRGDLAALAELMTPDHLFTDTVGATVAGKAACVDAWRGFFQQFPDYRNTFTQVESRGELAVAVGYSTCALPELQGPAIWTAAVRDGLVSHWRVYHDTPEVRAELRI